MCVSYQIVPLPIMPPTVSRYMSVRQWIKMFSLFEKGDGHFCWQGQSGDEWGAKVVTVHSRQRPIYNVSQSFWSILYFSSHFVLNKWRLTKTALCPLGGFHLQLLVFIFIYQFIFRIVTLVCFIICKWLVQKDPDIISESFQNLFVVFFTWNFGCTEIRWMLISSTAV